MSSFFILKALVDTFKKWKALLVGAFSDTANPREGPLTALILPIHSPRPWFFCVWEGPGGGRVCGLREQLQQPGHQPLCGADTRLNITGGYRVGR